MRTESGRSGAVTDSPVVNIAAVAVAAIPRPARVPGSSPSILSPNGRRRRTQGSVRSPGNPVVDSLRPPRPTLRGDSYSKKTRGAAETWKAVMIEKGELALAGGVDGQVAQCGMGGWF